MEVLSLIIHGSAATGSILFLIAACVLCIPATWMACKWNNQALLALSVVAIMVCVCATCIAIACNHEELMKANPRLDAEYLLSAWFMVFAIVAIVGAVTAWIYAHRHPQQPSSAEPAD